jgi:hypothetical protein
VKRSILLVLLVALLSTFAVACSGAEDDTTDTLSDAGTSADTDIASGVTVNYDFESDMQGWEGDVTGHANGAKEQFAFLAEVREVPDVENGGSGLYVEATNNTADLLIFVKRKLGEAEGIEPDTSYRAEFTIDFASKFPEDCPTTDGEKVFLKAGLSTWEPASVLNSDQTRWELNVDAGEGNTGGAQASTISNIAHQEPCDDVGRAFTPVTRTHIHRTDVKSAPDGSLWLLVVLDSELSQLNPLYFMNIEASLTPVVE